MADRGTNGGVAFARGAARKLRICEFPQEQGDQAAGQKHGRDGNESVSLLQMLGRLLGFRTRLVDDGTGWNMMSWIAFSR